MNQIDSMRFAGQVNQLAIKEGFKVARPGVTLREINNRVEEVISKAGCKPAFKNYQPDGAAYPFPAAACISPNDVVVHGIPGDYVLSHGDLLTIDVGTEYRGWYVDSARSRVIYFDEKADNPIGRAERLVEVTELILLAQLSVIKDQCTLLSMVEAAEEVARRYNVTIMPQWGGHGIGEKVHLPPFIPSAIDRTLSSVRQNIEAKRFGREKLHAGQTICIEPVVTYGSHRIKIDKDQWTVRQADGELTAHTERCLLVTEKGFELLS